MNGAYSPIVPVYQNTAPQQDPGYVAPVLASDASVRQDTFARADQAEWGMASDGHVWHRLLGDTDQKGAEGVQDQGGLVIYVPGVSDESPVLGPPLAGQDVEMLVRWTAIGDDVPNLVAGFVARALDASHKVTLLFAGDGYPIVHVAAGEATYGSDATISIPEGGVAFWSRFRLVGADHAWRTWADGLSEPDGWDGTWHDDNFPESGLTGCGVGLLATPGVDEPAEEGDEPRQDGVRFDHFRATLIVGD